MPGLKTSAKAGRGRSGPKDAAVVLHKASGKLTDPVSIALHAKAFGMVARQPGSTKALIETFGDALERSRRTGEAIKFVVAVGPSGHSEITPIEGAPQPEPAPNLTDDLDCALEVARARGRVRAAEILSGDDMLSAEQFAELIGTSRVTVNAKRQSNQVLGLDGAKRGFRFPEWQIDRNGKPFAAIPALFERLGGGPWTVYRFLIHHHPELDGLTGIEALRRGKMAQVLEVAEGVAQGTFA